MMCNYKYYYGEGLIALFKNVSYGCSICLINNDVMNK